MHIHPSGQMKGAEGGREGGGFTPPIGVRVAITKIKSLLNHDVQVECKCDD